jgi:hypothetical protein
VDDAGVLPESRYIRKETMLVARIFLAGAAQMLQRVTRFSLSSFQSLKKIGGVSAVIQLRQNLNLTMPPFLVLLPTISTIQTDAFIADKSGRSRRGFAPARIEPRGSGGGLRACLDDAGVIPESRYIRKEKMLLAHIFFAGAGQVSQPVTRISSSGFQSPRKSVLSRFEFGLVRISI